MNQPIKTIIMSPKFDIFCICLLTKAGIRHKKILLLLWQKIQSLRKDLIKIEVVVRILNKKNVINPFPSPIPLPDVALSYQIYVLSLLFFLPNFPNFHLLYLAGLATILNIWEHNLHIYILLFFLSFLNKLRYRYSSMATPKTNTRTLCALISKPDVCIFEFFPIPYYYPASMYSNVWESRSYSSLSPFFVQELYKIRTYGW